MPQCEIALTHEYAVPWELVVMAYIDKMENHADADVVRRDVRLQETEAAPPPRAAGRPYNSKGLRAHDARPPTERQAEGFTVGEERGSESDESAAGDSVDSPSDEDSPTRTARGRSPDLLAEWQYSIDFAVPWVLRKIFSLDTLQLATEERLDMKNRVLENTMMNVTVKAGINIDEWTRVEPNPATGGCTWSRRLTVTYPTWLPDWAARWCEKTYTKESVKARAQEEAVFAEPGCMQKLLRSEHTASFLRELGLAAPNGLRFKT